MSNAENVIRVAAENAASRRKILEEQIQVASEVAYAVSWDCLRSRTDLRDELKAIFAQTLTERALNQVFGKVYEVVPRPNNLRLNPSCKSISPRNKVR